MRRLVNGKMSSSVVHFEGSVCEPPMEYTLEFTSQQKKKYVHVHIHVCLLDMRAYIATCRKVVCAYNYKHFDAYVCIGTDPGVLYTCTYVHVCVYMYSTCVHIIRMYMVTHFPSVLVGSM